MQYCKTRLWSGAFIFLLLTIMKQIFTLFFLGTLLSASAKQWLVSPSGTYTTPLAVSSLVNAGDTVNIEAALYTNHPQVTFSKDNLFIRGINGRPRLEAGTALSGNVNGKAIFVISGKNCRIENIEFANAAVPDHNGAGIRQEGCDLYVSHCYFNGNEMGLLGGAYSACKVTMEFNQFANNGSTANPGYQHNVYIGHIDTFLFRYNYSINAIAEGHELKSRASNNFILYNFIANINTVDSRSIDLPNGGSAVIMGNVIEQGQNSSNSNLFGFGMEGLSNPAPHNVWLVNNTFVNKKSTGNFVQLFNGSDTLFMKNNILVGAKTGGLLTGTINSIDSSNNYVNDQVASAGFTDAVNYKYRPKATSPAVDAGINIVKTVRGYSLKPTKEYSDTADFTGRPDDGKTDIGAYEYQKPGGVKPISKNLTGIYPNPTSSGILTLESMNDVPYTIYSMNGRYVMGGLVINTHLDVSQLPSGTYFLYINGQVIKFMR